MFINTSVFKKMLKEVFSCKKDEVNQYTVPWKEVWDIGKKFDEILTEFCKTDVILELFRDKCRVIFGLSWKDETLEGKRPLTGCHEAAGMEERMEQDDT